jgi:hypothetical protein
MPRLFMMVLAASAAYGQEALVPFTWKSLSGQMIGTLRVPPGFKIRTWNYREGFITYLSYPDSSEIFLHTGSMMRVPILQGDEYIVSSEIRSSKPKVRIGVQRANPKAHWREDQHNVFLNIGFERVPSARLDQFNAAMDSFHSNAATKSP